MTEHPELVVHMQAICAMTAAELIAMQRAALGLRGRFTDGRPAVAAFWHEIACAFEAEMDRRGLFAADETARVC